MKAINKNIKIGTLVKIEGLNDFHKVKIIHPARKWIEIDGYVGFFQNGHIQSFKLNMHNKLRWSTLIDRANAMADTPVNRFREEVRGVYEYSPEQDAYLPACSYLSKDYFIEEIL